MLHSIELWKLAVDKSPDACSFVDKDNRFVYANISWCRMLGYSEAELKQMTWQQVTMNEDVGADEKQVKEILDGNLEDYYCEKTYIRKNGRPVFVGLYLHRYPEVGEHMGYVAFATQVNGGREYEELKQRFTELERIVKLMQHSETTTKLLAEKLDFQGKQIEQNREMFLAFAAKGDVMVGDRITGNANSTSRSNNSTAVVYAIITAIGFVCTVMISVAAVLAYVAYTQANNPNLAPPAIEQQILVPKE